MAEVQAVKNTTGAAPRSQRYACNEYLNLFEEVSMETYIMYAYFSGQSAVYHKKTT